MPKVNVIIPTFNCAKYIAEAIESVLNQTYKDFEIIVVDDGSTDNTREVLTNFNGKIKYLYQNNKGVAAARNLGISQTDAEFIAFLDGDDVWAPNKLSLQLEIMKENPEVAMIFTDGESFNEKGVVRTSLMRPQLFYNRDSFKNKLLRMEFNDGSQLRDISYEDFLISNRVFTSSALIRKRCLEEVGNFNESLLGAEDYDLWLRISNKYPLLYFNKVIARYRISDACLSGDFNFRYFNYKKWDAKMLELHLKECKYENQKLIKRRIVQSCNLAAWGFLSKNDLKETRRLSLCSLSYNKIQIKLYFYVLISFLPIKLVVLFRKVKNILCQKSV